MDIEDCTHEHCVISVAHKKKMREINLNITGVFGILSVVFIIAFFFTAWRDGRRIDKAIRKWADEAAKAGGYDSIDDVEA